MCLLVSIDYWNSVLYKCNKFRNNFYLTTRLYSRLISRYILQLDCLLMFCNCRQNSIEYISIYDFTLRHHLFIISLHI